MGVQIFTKIKKKQFGGLIKRKNKKQEKRESCFLKLVHPHGVIDIFCQPITAGEIMERYPNHYVTRTDFFKNPSIVVRPQSILVPGEMFFLVSHKTVDRTLKAKGKQSLEQTHDERYYNHRSNVASSSSNGGLGHESDSESFYRTSFYESWNEMQRRILQEGSYFDIDSPRRHVESPEQDEFQRVKSCLRRPDSDRRSLGLTVTFASPVVVRSFRLHERNFYVWTHEH